MSADSNITAETTCKTYPPVIVRVSEKRTDVFYVFVPSEPNGHPIVGASTTFRIVEQWITESLTAAWPKYQQMVQETKAGDAGENAELQGHLRDFSDKIAKQAEIIALLKGTLEFYADHTSYSLGPGGSADERDTVMEIDRGDRARRALEVANDLP